MFVCCTDEEMSNPYRTKSCLSSYRVVLESERYLRWGLPVSLKSGGMVRDSNPCYVPHDSTPWNIMVRPNLAPLFNRFSNLSTNSLWNSNIRDAVNKGQPHKALLLFRQMKQTRLQPSNFTFPFVAKTCANLSNLLYSQILRTHVAKSPFQFDIYVQTALVDMYLKCGHLDYAYNVFDKMPDRDLTSWNGMLMGFAQLGLVDKTVIVLSQMRLDGICPDSVTIMALTQLGSSLEDLMLCGDLGMAEMVFGWIDPGLRTVVSWNSMFSGYAYFEESIKAVGLYKWMVYDGVWPDVSTILSLLSSCVTTDALCHGKSIHCHGVRLGCVFNVPIRNFVISMYSKCGDIEAARSVFNSVRDRTCVFGNAIIGGYAEKGDLDEALALFCSTEAVGQKPDIVTLLYMISCCGQTGSLEVGRWIDNYAISNGKKHNVTVCNALIDMHAKCGSMRDAWGLFSTMQGKTVVSWTSMISGCALNGEFKEALELFCLMLELGLKPNHITFLAVLQACTHAGTGEYATHRLFELEPEAAALYVEMANLYASAGRWDGVARIRKLMKGNRVTKSAGQSFVQVNGTIVNLRLKIEVTVNIS
ncbi:hypothetical protein Vadar_029171 [Vaccinium darrowii]|uniref:Uncharacterized protein n=1 Tax=Vaccinium darrowii TaxID=229202 RepID=A0ACB7Z6Y3_9ERIC|nr:hypothetical protein Vadar_029171 [Vaccinium darrowii]